MEAHQQLEELILDRDTYAFEKEMGAKFASLVYEGKWFTPLREAEQAFIEKTQEYVTGEVSSSSTRATSSRPEPLLLTLCTMRTWLPSPPVICTTITMQKASSICSVCL